MHEDDMHSFLRGSKDAAIALGIRSFFNSKYSQIGQMTDVSVDTAKRELSVKLELAGEPTPVEIHGGNYRFEQRGEQATVTVGDASASREWASGLLREFVVGRTFVLPQRAAAIVKLLS
jgi:hypothetical protein